MAEDRRQDEDRDNRQLFCRIITPERAIFDDEADLVIARIADGDIGVMTEHAPTVSTVEIGHVRVRQGEESHGFATSDGFFKVSQNLVQILVEEAVPVDEIDVSEAEDRIQDAERELGNLSEDDEWMRGEIERQQRIGENLARVARRHGQG